MMNFSKFLLSFFLFTVLLINLGCSSPLETVSADQEMEPLQPEQEDTTTEPTPDPTETPLPQPTETIPPTPALEVVYEDDFSDPESGWERYNQADGVLDYDQDGYRMYVNAVNTYWVQANQDHPDIRVQADAQFSGGPDQNHFGVMCRLDTNTWEAYMFLITSQGQYGIAKYSNNALTFLGDGKMPSSEVIKQGQAVNQIRGDCLGSTLSLWVNGEKLLEVTDDALSEGDVGLVTGSKVEPGTEIVFDNFILYAP
jgi:hypothetical protein